MEPVVALHSRADGDPEAGMSGNSCSRAAYPGSAATAGAPHEQMHEPCCASRETPRSDPRAQPLLPSGQHLPASGWVGPSSGHKPCVHIRWLEQVLCLAGGTRMRIAWQILAVLAVALSLSWRLYLCVDKARGLQDSCFGVSLVHILQIALDYPVAVLCVLTARQMLPLLSTSGASPRRPVRVFSLLAAWLSWSKSYCMHTETTATNARIAMSVSRRDIATQERTCKLHLYL